MALHLALFRILVNGLQQHPGAPPPPAFEVSLLPEMPHPHPVHATAAPAPTPAPPPPVAAPPAPAPAPQALTVPAAPAPPAVTTAETMAPPRPVTHLRTGVNPIYIPPLEELQRRYPREARREGLSGQVLLRLTVSPAGDVTNAVVRASNPKGIFDALALDFVRRFRFEKGNAEFFVDQELIFKLNP